MLAATLALCALALPCLLWLCCHGWAVVRARRAGRLNCAGLHVFISGCDTGFGREVTKRLDEMGCYVHAACLTDAGMASLAGECSARVLPVLLDVSSDESVKACAETVCKRLDQHGHAKLWAIVNNAGVNDGFAVEATPMRVFRRVMDVNFFGLVATTKAMLPLTGYRAGSRVVNIASLAGHLAAPNMAAYTASKHAVEGFSDALRHELGLFGQHVAIVEPGFTSTPMVRSAPAVIDRIWSEAAPDVQARYGGSAYREAMRSSEARIQLQARPVDGVVDVIVSAVLAVQPDHRYRTFIRDRVLLALTYFLPSVVSDGLIRREVFSGAHTLIAAIRERSGQ